MVWPAASFLFLKLWSDLITLSVARGLTGKQWVMAAPADEYNEHILYNVDAHNACNLHNVYSDNVLPCGTKFIQHSKKHANSGHVYDLNRSYILLKDSN